MVEIHTSKAVKGHQNYEIDFDDLPLLTQLNIKVDRVTGQFQMDHGKYLPKIALLPSAPATISIRGISITSQYKYQLQRAYTEPQYIVKLQSKFEWQDSIIDIIAWKCLSISIKRIHREVLTLKCCNETLPMAIVLKLLTYQDTGRCCLCQAQETSEHMISCNHSTKRQWWLRIVTKIKERMTHYNPDESLIDVFCSCITDWLDTGSVVNTKYHLRYHRAIDTQQRIGWHHMFMGKLSRRWLRLQPSYDDWKGNLRPAYIWGASIVETCQQSYIELLEQRTADAHSPQAVRLL